MKRVMGTGLGVLLAASVTACLSAGIAGAVTTGTKRAHSCCPAPASQPAPAAKTSAGVPNCCLVLLQGKVTHAVFLSLGFQAVAASQELFSPGSAGLLVPVPENGLLASLLSRAVLSIRAPPLS